MSSSPNLILVGAQVDLGQYKAGMRDAVATTEAATQEISASFEKANVSSHEAMAGMAFAVEDSGIKMSRHFRRLLTEIPLVSTAFAALMPVLAIGVGVEILGKVVDKVVELTTEYERLSEAAKKSMDEISNATKKLISQDEKLLAIRRNTELVGKGSVEQAQLRARWAAEDARATTATTEELLKQYNASKLIVAAHEQDVAIKLHLMKKKDADPSLVAPSDAELQASLKNIAILEAAYGVGLQELQDKAAVEREKEKEDQAKANDARLKNLKAINAAIVAAHASAGQQIRKISEEVQKQQEQDADHTTRETLTLAEKQNAEIIKDADKQLAAWDEAYKGQIEAAKQASEIKIQQITQDFERGKINQQQEIALIAKAKQDELALEVLFHQKREALWAGDLKKVQEVENAIAKAQQQSMLVGTKAVTDGLKAQEQKYQQLFNQIASGFNTSLNGWIDGTQTASKAFTKMFDDILNGLLGFVEKWLEKKVEMWLMDKLIGQASQDASASAQIVSNAAVAAAGAYAATAAIPIVGPELAPAAAGLAYGDVLSFLAAAQFAAGTNYVPQDGLAYLHKGETVIPASKQGPAYSGSGGDVHVHFNVSAVDAESFQGHIKRHGNMIGNEVMRVLKRKGYKG